MREKFAALQMQVLSWLKLKVLISSQISVKSGEGMQE